MLGCASQVFLMTCFAGGELFVLKAMSYDCCPLHCDVIVNGSICVLMVGVSWATELLFGAIYTADTFSMPFCGSKVVPHFLWHFLIAKDLILQNAFSHLYK